MFRSMSDEVRREVCGIVEYLSTPDGECSSWHSLALYVHMDKRGLPHTCTTCPRPMVGVAWCTAAASLHTPCRNTLCRMHTLPRLPSANTQNAPPLTLTLTLAL